MRTNDDFQARGSNADGDRPAAERSILLVGVDPALIDSRIMERLNVGSVRDSRAGIDAELAGLGFTV